ncbi:MAG: potassium channel family protein [Atopobiaceae bacterium]|jgi:voltage-gated potassium channel|nr:potassium channel family protein [Atopobiaceae bacterium]MCI2173961.1 potassium channel family protein [Atopobiaceae bacterium]MCI2207949.1 potassium channel family protein [Atopobiaceae bacterium]
MRRLHVLGLILRRSKANHILWGFVAFVVLSALVILETDPGITTFGDALWYCYAVVTTVGFGDITTTSLVTRIVSVVLSCYAVIVIAIITGVVVDFYSETMQSQQRETLSEFLDELERLPELSQDELAHISERVRELRE